MVDCVVVLVLMSAVVAKGISYILYYVTLHFLHSKVPGEMLRQIRYLNEIEMKKLSTRSVQKALKQMQQNQLAKGISQTSLLDPVSIVVNEQWLNPQLQSASLIEVPLL